MPPRRDLVEGSISKNSIGCSRISIQWLPCMKSAVQSQWLDDALAKQLLVAHARHLFEDLAENLESNVVVVKLGTERTCDWRVAEDGNSFRAAQQNLVVGAEPKPVLRSNARPHDQEILNSDICLRILSVELRQYVTHFCGEINFALVDHHGDHGRCEGLRDRAYQPIGVFIGWKLLFEVAESIVCCVDDLALV